MKFSLKLLYLYLFSFIGLLVSVIGAIQIVDLGIKVYVFKGADRYGSYPALTKIDPLGKEVKLTDEEIAEQKRIQETETQKQRQRQASTALAMLLVGIPLYKYHWKLISAAGQNKNFL